MKKRNFWIMMSILIGSVILNGFLLLWNTAQDRVIQVSEAEISSLAEGARRSVPGSATWSRVLVQSEALVIVEEGHIVNFRGPISRDTQYILYVWERR